MIGLPVKVVRWLAILHHPLHLRRIETSLYPSHRLISPSSIHIVVGHQAQFLEVIQTNEVCPWMDCNSPLGKWLRQHNAACIAGDPLVQGVFVVGCAAAI